MYSAILWCIQTHCALHQPQHALVFTVVGSGLLALRTSRHTPAWLGISCWSFSVKKAVGDLTHHGGLLDFPLAPTSSGRCRSSVECANHGGASSSVQFSSVQFSSRWYSSARKTPKSCAPVSLSEVSPTSPLKRFQCSSYHPTSIRLSDDCLLVLSRKMSSASSFSASLFQATDGSCP